MIASHEARPLAGMLVVDFSQFLSGPSASLRLADLGARVIKCERSGVGDICRKLYISNLEIDGDSSLFHAINRNKESVTIDLKNEEDRQFIQSLIQKADVLIENFRPGVMQKWGLDYHHVRQWNPKLIYGEITGYGDEGPWKNKPGQDLLVQAYSGITWLQSDESENPMPLGLAIADMLAGAQLVQGILACMVRRGLTGIGAHVQVSLLEATLDAQSQALSMYKFDHQAGAVRSPHDYAYHLLTPAGIYATQDGYLALGVGSLDRLAELLDCSSLQNYRQLDTEVKERAEIKPLIAQRFLEKNTKEWIEILQAGEYPCADVWHWEQLLETEMFAKVDFIQSVERANGTHLWTTRCPIRIHGRHFTSSVASPVLGEHRQKIQMEPKG